MKLEFNAESFVMITLENLKLQKELNEALAEILELRREANSEVKNVSPYLKVSFKK